MPTLLSKWTSRPGTPSTGSPRRTPNSHAARRRRIPSDLRRRVRHWLIDVRPTNIPASKDAMIRETPPVSHAPKGNAILAGESVTCRRRLSIGRHAKRRTPRSGSAATIRCNFMVWWNRARWWSRSAFLFFRRETANVADELFENADFLALGRCHAVDQLHVLTSRSLV